MKTVYQEGLCMPCKLDFGLDSVDQRFVNYFRRRRDWEVCGVRDVTDPSENLNKVNVHTNRTRVYISGCSQIC